MLCIIQLVTADSSETRIWLRDDQTVTIGRQASADLCVQDPHLSRCHFVVEGDASEGFRLRDMNSRNGTWLNGIQVATATLKSGDRVVAGESHFAVTLPDERAQPVATSVPTPKRFEGDVPTEPLPRSPLPVGPSTASSSPEVSPVRNLGSRSESVWKLHDYSFRPTDVASFNTTADFPKSPSDTGLPQSSGDTGYPQGPPFGSRIGSPRVADTRNKVDHIDEVTLSLADPAPLLVEGPRLVEGLEEFELHPAPVSGEGRAFIVGRKGGGARELCERLGRYYRLVFIVNREQLDPDAMNLLNYHVDRGEIEPLSKTLFRVDGDSPTGLGIQLFRRASRRDGAICLGFRYSDRELDTTVRDFAHLLCFPSLLARHLNGASALRERPTRPRIASESPSVPFFSRVVFAMFEPGRSGGLSFHAEHGFRLSGTLVA